MLSTRRSNQILGRDRDIGAIFECLLRCTSDFDCIAITQSSVVSDYISPSKHTMFADQIRWQLNSYVEILLIIWQQKGVICVLQLKRIFFETHFGLEILRSFQGAQTEREASQVVTNQFHIYVDSVVYSVPKITEILINVAFEISRTLEIQILKRSHYKSVIAKIRNHSQHLDRRWFYLLSVITTIIFQIFYILYISLCIYSMYFCIFTFLNKCTKFRCPARK